MTKSNIKSEVQQLRKSRRAIERTVRKMGGQIQWTTAPETVLEQRAKRRIKTVRKWRQRTLAKSAVHELNDIANRSASENRTMTKPEAARFDKLLERVNLAIKNGERFEIVGYG